MIRATPEARIFDVKNILSFPRSNLPPPFPDIVYF
jgi:hypothetical protein